VSAASSAPVGIASAVGAATALTARAIAPQWATTAATAAAFAGIHGFLVVMPYALVAGIVTGWLRERTGSVAAGFVTHVLNNATLVATTMLLTG
jgi:membrane protease YdiL (CAAX protease family)